jgi:exopolysaccharide biosynthesis WecB/TagA/CpsF family protein
MLFGLPVDILSADETIDRIVTAIDTRQRCQHVALNVAKLVNARTNAELDRDVRESDIVGIDGMGIVYALRLLGHTVPQRVAGVDLFESLMTESASRGLRPYLLGATPEVLAAARRNLSERHPGLIFAGSHHGYFTAEQEASVCDQIRLSAADCLFIAMPTPRKERFMARHRDDLGIPFCHGRRRHARCGRRPGQTRTGGGAKPRPRMGLSHDAGATSARRPLFSHQSDLRCAAPSRLSGSARHRRRARKSDIGVAAHELSLVLRPPERRDGRGMRAGGGRP